MSTSTTGLLTQKSPQRVERAKSLIPRHLREHLLGYLFISPWLIGFFVFVAGAMGSSLVISFLETDMLQPAKFVGFANYQRLVNDELVAKALLNTAYYSVAMVPLGIVVAFLIALALNQGVAGQGLFRTLYYLPAIVSGVAVSVLWSWVFHPDLGLINGLLAQIGIRGPRWLASEEWAMPALIIMGIWRTGGNMLIYLAGLQSIPSSLPEAASIDGANAWQRFRYITVPLMSPTIYFSLILGIIDSWQVFTQAYVLTAGGPNNATLTMVLYLYRQGFQNFRFGYGSALAWLLFAIILLLTLLVIRSSQAWVYYAGELRK